MFPQTIDPDTRSQRVARVGDGPGQFQSAAAVFERLAVRTGDHLQKLTRNSRTGRPRVAPLENPRVERLTALLQNHGIGKLVRDA
jgi:hypothetical protein